ncbi:MAG: hypothetical protein ABL930_03415 [Pseudobdellovibrio sp.]
MKFTISIVVLAFVISGCATQSKHEHTSGSIVALDSKTEAHVCLTSSSPNIGELVDVFEVVCIKTKIEKDSSLKRPPNQEFTTTCKRQKRGHAKIVENSDNHFAKVRSEGSLELKEGYLIETSQNTLN